MSAYIARAATLTYRTKYRLEFINITADLERVVKESGVKTGTVTIQTHHTTCGVWVNEDEKNLIGPEETLGYAPDLKKILDRFAHPADEYCHNDICDRRNPAGRRNTHLCEPDERGVIRECVNGHAHAQAMILPSSVNLIIKDGKLLRGRWQEVLFVELDHDRERQITILAQGETA